MIDVELSIDDQYFHAGSFIGGFTVGAPYGSFVVQHANSQNLPVYFEHMGDLFAQAVQADDDSFLEKMALFEYYFSYATPFLRGSASIREMITRGIYHAKGYRQSPYRKGIPMDLRAFSSPLIEEFIEGYPRYFRKSPKKGFWR